MAQSSSLISTPGIVLRRFNSRGADLILRILTKDFGKISLAVRNGRTSKGNFKGGIDVFDCGIFIFNKKEKGLSTLKDIEQREIWLKLRQNIDKFSLASIAVEATDIFAKENDAELSKVFPSLFLCLKNINSQDNPVTCITCLNYFLLELLNLSGFDILAKDDDFRKSHLGQNSGIDSGPSTEMNWFKEMRKRNIAFFPGSNIILKDAFYILLKEIEAINSWPLNSMETGIKVIENHLNH